MRTAAGCHANHNPRSSTMPSAALLPTRLHVEQRIVPLLHAGMRMRLAPPRLAIPRVHQQRLQWGRRGPAGAPGETNEACRAAFIGSLHRSQLLFTSAAQHARRLHAPSHLLRYSRGLRPLLQLEQRCRLVAHRLLVLWIQLNGAVVVAHSLQVDRGMRRTDAGLIRAAAGKAGRQQGPPQRLSGVWAYRV